MSKNIDQIPFTEIIERACELARLREDVEKKVRGIANDVYLREIPRVEDWSFLMVKSCLTYTPEYATGSISVNTGGTTASFSSDTALTSNMTARKLKITGNDYVYDFTYSSATSGTIQPPLSGISNITSQAFSIFQGCYSLAADFDRFPKNGGLHSFSGGKKVVIPEKSYQYAVENYSPITNDTRLYCRLLGADTAGNQILEVNPPPKNALSEEYDYIKKLKPMRETTAGLATISAQANTVLGDVNSLFTQANTGDYFRIDAFGTSADSEWYPIIAINGNSSLTLGVAFGLSGATAANYTISSKPDMPTLMHQAILYGTVLQIITDQDDPMVIKYKQDYAMMLTDGKRLYKSREYNQEVKTVAQDYLYRR